jgi:hypothetical protein
LRPLFTAKPGAVQPVAHSQQHFVKAGRQGFGDRAA